MPKVIDVGHRAFWRLLRHRPPDRLLRGGARPRHRAGDPVHRSTPIPGRRRRMRCCGARSPDTLAAAGAQPRGREGLPRRASADSPRASTLRGVARRSPSCRRRCATWSIVPGFSFADFPQRAPARARLSAKAARRAPRLASGGFTRSCARSSSGLVDEQAFAGCSEVHSRTSASFRGALRCARTRNPERRSGETRTRDRLDSGFRPVAGARNDGVEAQKSCSRRSM